MSTTRDFANYLKNRLEVMATDEAMNNGAGSALDWADYKARVGRVKGLKRAHDLIDESMEKFLNDDEGETI